MQMDILTMGDPALWVERPTGRQTWKITKPPFGKPWPRGGLEAPDTIFVAFYLTHLKKASMAPSIDLEHLLAQLVNLPMTEASRLAVCRFFFVKFAIKDQKTSLTHPILDINSRDRDPGCESMGTKSTRAQNRGR
jgi:hypothetical protein